MILIFIAIVPFIFGICLLLSGILANRTNKYFEKNKTLTKAKIVGYAHHGHDSSHSYHELTVSLIDINDGKYYSCYGLYNSPRQSYQFGTIVDVYIAPKKFGKFKYYDVRLAEKYKSKGSFGNILIGISIGLFTLSVLFAVVGLIKII